METKELSKLSLHQETVRSITHNDQPANVHATRVPFPVCTPVFGMD